MLDWFRKFRAEHCPICGKEFEWQRGHIKIYGKADATGLIGPTQRTCLECGRNVAKLNARMLIHKSKNITYAVKRKDDSAQITVTCDVCGYKGNFIGNCPKCDRSYMPPEVYKLLMEIIGDFREALK